jgi:non-specific serine/threonine protein kinase
MASVASAPWSLPQPLSSFVGRRSEIEELKRIFAAARLLTLTGPGGCGKTRLVIEAAAEVSGWFQGGVAFVDLATIREAAGVAEAVATALGLAEQASGEVATLIGEARLLLVIDNAEHLVEAVSGLLEDLLRRCLNLSILVTSRELLNVDGEVSWRVPPLQLPPPPAQDAAVDLAEVMAADAVQLFVTRAAEHQTSFRLAEDNALLVDAICRCLDGIPLALELAAARVRSLALPEIVARLRDSEIVRMVAVGLSNKEIGQRMSISERTVEAHLEQVRNQLGFNNRAQLAAWVVARGLETA